MARKPGVRVVNGHWFSESGGVGRYFGRVDATTRTEAMASLWTALADGSKGTHTASALAGDRGVGGFAPTGVEPGSRAGRKELTPRATTRTRTELVPSFRPDRDAEGGGSKTPTLLSTPPITVAELRDKYLAWIGRHRSEALHREAKRHLGRWCESVRGEASDVEGSHLEAFTDALAGDGHAPMYVKKHATTVRAMFNKGVKTGWLPQAFRPFALVETIRLDPRPLLESDLPTSAEVRAIIDAARDDMLDIVGVYHATGMRTHELIEARVGDFQRNARTIVLGRHKRSRTMREPIPRTVTLNAVAHAILDKRCENRDTTELIFPNKAGKPYTSVLLDDRFATLRKRAGVRAGITPYSFRHLWISEALMAGVDVLVVARMAGTSVKMIETVYGHFRTSSYTDAQARLDAVRALQK